MLYYYLTGIEKVLKLMEKAELKFTGMEHYRLAKVSLKRMLRKYESGGSDERKGEEEVAGMKPEDMEPSSGNEQGKIVEKQTEAKQEDVGVNSEGSTDEGVDKEGQLKLEDLDPILELCKKAYSLSDSYGKKGYYCVNGLLLSVVSPTSNTVLTSSAPPPLPSGHGRVVLGADKQTGDRRLPT